MAKRIRTLDFLPEIFQTDSNRQFLSATLDQLVNPPVTERIQGYIGSKFGYGINANDYYVTEPTKIRRDYQLDPGVVFTKNNETVAQDFISYPGILDAIKLAGGLTEDNNKLFSSQFYSWDSFTSLDKIINFNQYYWLPEGPPSVTVASGVVFSSNEYTVTDTPAGYNISSIGSGGSTTNPTITLLRGGVYEFIVDQDSEFWIQTQPSVSGYSLSKPNLYVRDVLGVTNNGATQGIVTFIVPAEGAQNEFEFPGNNTVDLISTQAFANINGQTLSAVGSIDGVTSLENLTVMFYDTGVVEPGVSDNFYTIQYTGNLSNPTLNLVATSSIPVNEKITATYGDDYAGLTFYKQTTGTIARIPLISAPLDTLYYQDGASSNKVGIIKIINSNLTNTIDVETDILGKKNYTSTNGVVFTNGLKVTFDGDVIPSSYLSGEYYVEGVGTAIQLIPVSTLICPEDFTRNSFSPFDILPYDIGAFDSSLFIPLLQDYITIARNSINLNPWSRSNRWFHIDVIRASSSYNNDPSILTTFATAENKAKRPIIEFYPNLKLFDSGTEGKNPIDFIDFRTTDAFNTVAGKEIYYPDVEVYTQYTGVLNRAGAEFTGSITGTTLTVSSIAAGTITVGGIVSGLGVATGTEILSQLSGTPGGIGTYQVDTAPPAPVTTTPMLLGVFSTTATIDADDIVGRFQLEQYINDSDNLLPNDAIIDSISATTTVTLNIVWNSPQTFNSASNVSFIANDVSNANFVLFPGARIVFAADENESVRTKIYVANFSPTTPLTSSTITLTEAPDGQILTNNQVVSLRGYNAQGKSYYYDGLDWIEAQQKINVNQPPLFDVFDQNGISFGNKEIYVGTSFAGCKLFAYGIGSGIDDSVLGFPLRYSYINNVGDISFDVSLNGDTFDYVTGTSPVTQKVNTGYVYNYDTRDIYTRLLGWQTAVGPSTQYQIFEFDVVPLDIDSTEISQTFICDVAKLDVDQSEWPTIEVYYNNNIISASQYTVTVDAKSTTVSFVVPNVQSKVQILLLSDQVSSTAYYSIPINLSNNPFNTDLTTVNIGDIRGQYQSIYVNNPDFDGTMFGANNYRDLGNLVPYGNRIIQNSASLALPAAFLRKQNHNLFDALKFNSREYIKFKNLLVSTVNNSNYEQRYDAATMLDDALDQISSTKNNTQPFFWSDMLPSKAPFITNIYTFANNLDTSIYPLSKIYDFESANYNGVLVYLTRTVSGITKVTQLIKGVDYEISTDSPSLIVSLDLLPGDVITVKEYNQTYGSYIPNTPTKLGLYPATIPGVILDPNYMQPTYFIRGHDGSYNRLYGDYFPNTGVLVDFRDQVLLEFETRIYNNLKLQGETPIKPQDVIPGFFRTTDYNYDQWLEIYSSSFLDWVGQNRLNFKTQTYSTNDEYTYNYRNSSNRLDNKVIPIGYWRGIYEHFYDTSNPDIAPWEMLGFTNQPSWWETRYGPAPYTKDNLVLWNDLAEGINWNNGDPYIIESAVRDGLLKIIPVDENGDLVSPLYSVIGNYNSNNFRRDWIVGDDGPVELSYRRSSTWPFDLMRLYALTLPAQFFNLGVDLDNYRYNEEFNQWLVNDRSHLVPSNVQIYGNGTAKTSYINWIVDYEKQLGIDATKNIKDLLFNLDVRLVYRMAGFSDKTQLKFFVEKGTPNSVNASLLIPDESYSLLLYDNQPFDKLVYTGVIVQIVNEGYMVYGNSQTNAYFKTLAPLFNGKYDNITVEDVSVKVATEHSNKEIIVPYGTLFYSTQEVSQFLINYGSWLTSKGMIFDDLENAITVNWRQMIAEFLYWSQMGWEIGSVATLNPSANVIKIDKDNQIVQPLVYDQNNFILNQNLYPIQNMDLSILRDETYFQVKPLNAGDTLSYGQFSLSNFEHGIVFDNVTLFNDIIYNLVTGLRQNRIYVSGAKTAEWNGTVTTSGFILNQDNVTEWKKEAKYTKGSIVKYKNKYWTALKIIQPGLAFNEKDWKITDYNEIQKGLLPNPSTNSYESTLYYDVNKANLEKDADLLSFSLIGYRPRDYLATADLTDITQINVYKNFIKNKGTKNALNAFRGINLGQGGIDYEVYENWAIKSGQFGGVLNDNFVQFKLNQTKLTANPSIVSLTNGIYTPGSQQEVPLYSLFNYGYPVTDPNILPTLDTVNYNNVLPDAGYVNFNDIKMSAYFYSQLPSAVNKEGILVPLADFYVRDYVWIADYLAKWQVFTPESIGQVIQVRNNLNNTVTVTFAEDHDLQQFDIFAIVNFDTSVDGYYVVTNVVNTKQVIINLVLDQVIRTVTGQGIGLRFQSQRVDTPADISNLPLLSSEFIKNKVWVDQNTDGDWAVYRKAINYQYENEFTKNNTVKFGSAVAYSQQAGYLIGDEGAGQVFRYTFNDFSNTYELNETLTQSTSFGSVIENKENIYVISQPTGTPRVYIYTINDSKNSDDFLLYQPAITPPGGVTDWGSSVTLSDDTHWLYISDIDNNIVHVYRKQNIQLTAGYLVPGETYQITELGDTDWEIAGAIENKVGMYFVALNDGSALISGGTVPGIATQVTYKPSTTIDASGFLTAGDNFGESISTDYHGDTVVIGAPYYDYDMSTQNWGQAYVYQRATQNIEVQFNNLPDSAQSFPLAWTPTTLSKTVAKTLAGNLVRLNNVSGISVDDPIIFTGTGLTGTDIETDFVYYVESISGNDITLKLSRSSTSVVTIQPVDPISNVTATVQNNPLYVTVNGVEVLDNNYAAVGSNFYYTSALKAGDIVSVSDNLFTLVQTLTTQDTPKIGVQFGTSADMTLSASEIIVGAPFALSTINQEGAVYRYTNGGGKYGLVTGTVDVNVTVERNLLLNGFLVKIPAGNATVAANAINGSNITNISAANSNGKLVIQINNIDLTVANEKLLVTATNSNILTELGLQVYTQTQVIQCPHSAGPSQFGSNVKFNERDSFVASAPVGRRFAATTFDFIDDELDNDTVFDNNATQFIDSYPNAGAVYMFDYLGRYNESLDNTGSFVYAQSVNAQNQVYGSLPRYGTALDFVDNRVMIGTPDFRPTVSDGQVITYVNETGIRDWSEFRQSSPVVDINRVKNLQIFSAETNDTLINLDYMDPLQGKLLGAIRENIDVISNIDPASYNNDQGQKAIVWGAGNVGQIWFDTSNVRFVNYHQNDVVYNSQYWGTIFPGSDVAVYTWIESNVPPSLYQGPGTPFNLQSFVTQSTLNASNVVVPIYYFWVRNTNIIFKKRGKTLADSVLAAYLSNPKGSGISYLAPLLPNSVALYNSLEYINSNDSVLQLGYSTGTNDDPSHNEFNLIRANFADDFLPGFPIAGITTPESLYDRLLDSLSGVDEAGSVVPNPYLPKAVQSGVLARPRQSFFFDRYEALKNYLTYANEVLKQFPITETRITTFLFATGEFYNTPDYWEYVNWWAEGYDDNTKSALQVPIYADLSTLNVTVGTLVTVATNGDGKQEVYRYDGDGVWTRIGLQNGTIQFKVFLWDYAEGKLGFGDNFFDTNVYDLYPSEETRWIIRALNEQIYTNELLIYRNKSLILLFEYIQSETTESQNFLPWLSKTSLVDVSHKIRELRPYEVFQSNNQEFLEGYLNEVKPYHVVIKEFLLEYTGEDIFTGSLTDFDLPARYNSSVDKFISPQLVYEKPIVPYQYLNTDNIWNEADYTNWKENYGVSLTGQNDYEISVLESYLTLSTNFIIVDNASGFPINGVIKIGNELISYSNVDRATNTLTGLLRGINNTTVVDHIPGEKIYMDLPAVLLLDGGRAYENPPRVLAYIDTDLYPLPTREAVLEAIMSLDTVIGINVIDPGQGYAVLPEIRIDPAFTIEFNNTAINSLLNTITLFAPLLQTGDLVRYRAISGSIDGLENNQWYYVNLLESSPATIIALYASLDDALKDHNRIELYSVTAGSFKIELGAKASAISTSYPIRQNNITLRFDRTTYDSQVIDWEAGRYYGAFFAGNYNNSQDVSSSSVQLESTQPPIESIYASAQGLVFEITDVANDSEVVWSSFERTVYGTTSIVDTITLNVTSPIENASGSTIGFTENMPIKFVGDVAGTNIINGEVYYIDEVVSLTDFKIKDANGTPISLNTQIIGPAGLKCYTADVTDTAVLTVNYPGIREATATAALTNKITVPMSEIGTGGTSGFYINLPVFFVGDVFGGIRENQVYYVTTVVDEETFTISESKDPLTVNVTEVSISGNVIALETTVGLSVNDPVIFNTMVVSGSPVTSLGGINSGTTYYISTIINATDITVSTAVNGIPVTITSNIVAPSVTEPLALMTSQKDTVKLTTATGSMTMNISLPASPGQVDGQRFTLYNTSNQYPNVSATLDTTTLVNRAISAVIAGVDRIAIVEGTGGTENMYVNMPVRVDANIDVLNSSTTYYIIEKGVITINATQTIGAADEIVCDSTASLYVDMPIVFSGFGLGGIVVSQVYFVLNIVNGTNFTISEDVGGSIVNLSDSTGVMTGTGEPYIKLSTSIGGSSVTISSTTLGPVLLEQYPTSAPTFDVSYILGGYRVIIPGGGTGYTVNNVFTIDGSLIGGTTPENDLTLTIDTINQTTGSITNVICSGTPAGSVESYYLKVISPTQFKVYTDPLFQVPVSGINFPYTGFTSTTVTQVQANTPPGVPSTITVSDASQFSVNDAVVFSGDVAGSIDENQTYYIVNKSGNILQISTDPAGTPAVLTVALSTNFAMTKSGSYALLPEPFYFSPSIVKFNNRLYICIVSNNDDEFIFGKWELLDSGDRRLNAMDRVMGYYQPTDEMPGIDLTQLFAGVTYPNSTYLGNAFDPNDQYPVDVELLDQPFYLTGINSTAVAHNGTDYIVASNLNNYSALLSDVGSNEWDVAKFTESDINLTDLIFAGSKFLMTSTNSATPIFRSNNGLAWSVNAVLAPNNQPIASGRLSLNSIAYGNGRYVAVGKSIVTSTDAYTWQEVYTFDPTFNNRFYAVTYVDIPGFTGFVAVGKGQRFDYSTGFTEIVDTNLISYSSDGVTWLNVSSLTTKGLYAVAANGSDIIATGEDGIVYTSNNGGNWFGINEVEVIGVNGATDVINVTNTSGLNVDDEVRFTASFDDQSPGPGYNVIAGVSYYINAILSPTQIQLATTPTPSSPIDLTGLGTIPSQTLMYIYPRTATVRDLVYADARYMAVGDNGLIQTSTNGIAWTAQTSGTTEDLNGLTYVSGSDTYTVVGDNNTILQSSDDGVTWIASDTFNQSAPIYNVQGDPFLSGYGPEELVPGVISDNLTMTVTTRAGTDWDATEYAHVGYNVLSLEIAPTSPIQTEYSFFTPTTNVPAQLKIFVIDGSTGLSTTLYDTEYTIDWINQNVVLNNPLSLTDKLRIDIYEVGNGSQLVKSNTFSDPLVTNNVSGFSEITLNCLYSAPIFAGNGAIRPNTQPLEEQALSTSSATNSIFFATVTDFVVNDPIIFTGDVFGGLVENATYYVKTISTASNSITVSDTLTMAGVAGATYNLTDYSGSDVMFAILQAAPGLVWTDPIAYHNGNKLIHGNSSLIVEIDAATDRITTISTGGMYLDQPIVFCDCLFTTEIDSMTTYYISEVTNGSQFKISTTIGGPSIDFTINATGSAMYITSDYAIVLADNGINAKLVFAGKTDPGDPTMKVPYDDTVDYLVYSVFGDAFPIAYGYTIPETQMLVGDGANTVYNLINNVTGTNDVNAIVELEGLRLLPADYTIDINLDTITFTSAPTGNIAVVTFNDTDRQYLNTQVDAGTSVTVSSIYSINNNITAPIAETEVTNTTVTTDVVTCDSTAGFIAGQTIQFKGVDLLGFGNLVTDGTVYYVRGLPATSLVNGTSYTIASIGTTDFTLIGAASNTVGLTFTATGPGTGTGEAFSATEFRVADETGTIIPLTTASGSIKAIVGGQPAVRVFTTTNNNLSTNDLVRIDGVQGSVQLNNNLYYVHVINSTTFDLYEYFDNDPSIDYDPLISATNYPVTDVFSYTGGGYVWQQNSFILYDTIVTGTSTTTFVDVADASTLVANTPVYFTENGISLGQATSIPELIAGDRYFIREVEPIEEAGGFVIGRQYRILFVGTTDFTLIGAASNTPGLLFTATGTGSGDGTAFTVNTITLSLTHAGDEMSLTSGIGPVSIRLAQWEQTNVDRLWVTINGYRVPSSNLSLNAANEVGILLPIVPGDDIIITSMMPSATPDEEVYLLNVNQINQNAVSSVYRANTNTRTWLTEPLYDLDDVISVRDVTRLIDNVVQNVITPAPVGGLYTIGIAADKNIITLVTIFNNTTNQAVTDFELIIENIAPVVKISSGVTAGDSLTVTTTIGNLIYVNGEQIIFSTVNFTNNTVSGLKRGANGTGIQSFIPKFTEVYGLLSTNRMTDVLYSDTWNKIPGIYNTAQGDPLQISLDDGANFLRVDVS